MQSIHLNMEDVLFVNCMAPDVWHHLDYVIFFAEYLRIHYSTVLEKLLKV